MEKEQKTALEVVKEFDTTGEHPLQNEYGLFSYEGDRKENSRIIVNENLVRNSSRYVSESSRNRNKVMSCCCCSLTHCFLITFVCILLFWGTIVTWMAINANNTDDRIYGELFKVAQEMGVVHKEINSNTNFLNELNQTVFDLIASTSGGEESVN